MAPPAVKEIIFRSVVEDSLRIIGLETGEIDIALDTIDNSQVDRLLNAGKVETDQTIRLNICRKIQQMIIADAPDVMLFNNVLLVGTQAEIGGLDLHPVTLHDFYPITPGKS